MVPLIVRSAVVAVYLAATAAAQSQEQRRTFRTGIDLIQIDVSVLDKNRMPVRGLTAADFVVLENGVARPVEAFSAVDLPDIDRTRAAWTRDIAPDVVSNDFDARRIVTIVLDDFSIPIDKGPMATRIARQVVEQLGPNDLAAVVYTVIKTNGQEPTASRERLLAAIDRFRPTGFAAPRVSTSGYRSASEPNRTSGGPTASGACMRQTCITGTLKGVAETFETTQTSRKTLVFISPAMTLTMTDPEYTDVTDEIRGALAAMQRANINVYQFDPRGLEVGYNIDDDFEVFSSATGGRSTYNTNTPWEQVPQVFRENSSYYLLGFRSGDTREDGRFRKLTVKVNRPDVEVRTRAGYFASSASKPKKSKGPEPGALDRAIVGALPASDLPIALTVAPFAGSDPKKASLAIVLGLDVRELPAGDVVELDARAFNENFKEAQRVKQNVDISAPAGGHADITTRLDVPPGRYQVRVALRSRAADRAGSMYQTVTVPDFSKVPLSLSGVVLTRGRPPAAGEPLAALLPVAPITTRAFAPTEEVTAFLRLYQGARVPLASTRLTVRIADDSDRVVAADRSSIAAAEFDVSRRTDYRYALPLSRLSPGAYLLTIEASAGKAVERRQVKFEVN